MAPDLTFRYAIAADLALLAQMNRDLIEDEQVNNQMSVAELEERMRDWLASGYQAVMFEQNDSPVAYALFKPDEYGVYLRQFFVARLHRRLGIGRDAIRTLVRHVFPRGRRVTVEA